MPQNQVQTIEITNFGGRLTRKKNGDMNSGFANFLTSWGYDPFSKPDNLTWLEQPVDIGAPIDKLPLAAKNRYEGANGNVVYLVTQSGSVLAIKPMNYANANLDSVIGISSVVTTNQGSGNFQFGSSIDFFGATEKMYVSGDVGVVSKAVPLDSTGVTFIGSTGNYASNTFKPLKQFIGQLFFGNGNTIGSIDSTGTITSSVVSGKYSALNPNLGADPIVQDLDSSIDGNQLLITGSAASSEQLDVVGKDTNLPSPTEGTLYRWNGSDITITSFTTIPSQSVTALQTYLGNNIIFSNDTLGSSVGDGTNKILTLPYSKSPLPNATAANGNFVTWLVPEVSTDMTKRYATLYYFGSLDGESQPGLWRVMRWTTTLSGGFVYQCPVNVIVSNSYQTINSAGSALVTLGYGKHYIGVGSTNSSGTYQYNLMRFLVTPTGTGTPQLGVYETQTQLFAKKMTSKQIRVYTEPTATGNGFQIDLIGSDGNVLTNGTATYTFAAGTDSTLLQGSLQRIDFNLTSAPTYAMGVRITNTGTANMTIKKIEVDWVPAGK